MIWEDSILDHWSKLRRVNDFLIACFDLTFISTTRFLRVFLFISTTKSAMTITSVEIVRSQGPSEGGLLKLFDSNMLMKHELTRDQTLSDAIQLGSNRAFIRFVLMSWALTENRFEGNMKGTLRIF